MATKTDRAFGSVASFVVDYNIAPSIAMSATAQYQFDSVTKASPMKFSAL